MGLWPSKDIIRPSYLPPHTVAREEWSARAPRDRRTQGLPVQTVSVSYTDTEPCTNKEECIRAVQTIQKLDMQERGAVDIEHHFLIGGDGRVYEGRGWRSVGKQYRNEDMSAQNYKSIDIAYIGYYEDIAMNFCVEWYLAFMYVDCHRRSVSQHLTSIEKEPNRKMVDAAIDLIRFGLYRKFIDSRLKVIDIIGHE